VITPKVAILSLLACAVAVYLCLPLKPRDSSGGPDAPIHIDLWQPWGGITGDQFRRVVAAFNATHPRIQVRPVYSPMDNSGSTKFFISVAAGVPPDLAFVDGPQVAAWAELGLLDPLDDFFAREQIQEDAYWPPCWRQCQYQGHTWAITYAADPNFALVWNKTLFRNAGLDPEAPPRTIAEVDSDCDRLTKFDANGYMLQMGMMPWLVYGGANTIFTWGWLFGGHFYDAADHRVTADDPPNVAALEWLDQSAHRFGFERVNAFSSTFGAGAQDPFFTGRIAMEAMHLSIVEQMPDYAPGLDFGIAPLPAPPGGEYGASWVGGWTIAVPRDSTGRRTPERKAAALAFLKWACASDEGTAIASKTMQLFPGYKRCPYFAEVRAAPPGSYEATFLSPYLRILETTKHQRPAMPAQAKYMFELERAYSRTLFGQASAAAALTEATRHTQQALDQILHRRAIETASRSSPKSSLLP
jgi:multiple sugar transport system substrate-binding protein